MRKFEAPPRGLIPHSAQFQGPSEAFWFNALRFERSNQREGGLIPSVSRALQTQSPGSRRPEPGLFIFRAVWSCNFTLQEKLRGSMSPRAFLKTGSGWIEISGHYISGMKTLVG
jgi:hypothetical protein